MAAKPAGRANTATGVADQAESIIDAAEKEFADRGLGGASLDNVARMAGVSRSTLYRRFPNKSALVAGVLERIIHRVSTVMDTAIEGLGPEDAIVGAFTAGFHWLRDSALLNRLLTEDSRLWVEVTGPIRAWIIDSMSRDVRGRLRAAGATQQSDEQLYATSEMMVRLTLSYAEHPSPLFSQDNDDSVRLFARNYLTPLIR